MATKTTTELKVFLEGTLEQYDALSDTDKAGSVFFDKANHAVYAAGNLIAQTLVKSISVSGSILTIFYASGLQESIDFSIPDAFVRFDKAQSLLTSQQSQARANIGAVSTGELTTELAKKVNKVDGKGLSQEDFTTALKTKLEGLSNYDDATITAAVESLQEQLNTLVGGEDVEGAIDTFNEIIAFLDGIEDETLEGIIAGIENQIASKYTKPSTGIPTGDIANGAVTYAKLSESVQDTIDNALTAEQITPLLNAKYTKPSTGIPASDLAEEVQDSLGTAYVYQF